MESTENTQNWRLSKIEEELGRLSFAECDDEPLPPPPPELLANDSTDSSSSTDVTSGDLLSEISSGLNFDLNTGVEVTDKKDVNDEFNGKENDGTSNRDSAIEDSEDSSNADSEPDEEKQLTSSTNEGIDATFPGDDNTQMSNIDRKPSLHYDIVTRQVTPENEQPNVNSLGLIRIGSPKKDTTPKVEVVPIITRSPHRLSSANLKIAKKRKSAVDPIYSSVNVTPKDDSVAQLIEKEKEAIKRISEKYDSYKLKGCFIENNMCPPTPPKLGPKSMDDGAIEDQPAIYSTPNNKPLSNTLPRASDRSSIISQSTIEAVDDNVFDDVTDSDIMQVEMFYKSHKAEVHVCPCLASLYFGKLDPGPAGIIHSSMDVDRWEFFKTGIPVIILNSGESRRSRSLTIILSEKGSGFILWKDVMNHLTNYQTPHVSFHTLHDSKDHTKVAGLSFETPSGAADCYRLIKDLTSDPEDPILNLSAKKNKKSKDKSKHKKQKFKPLKKTEISLPCGFEHITKLDRNDAGSVLNARDIEIKPKLDTDDNQSKTITIKKRHSSSSLKNTKGVPD